MPIEISTMTREKLNAIALSDIESIKNIMSISGSVLEIDVMYDLNRKMTKSFEGLVIDSLNGFINAYKNTFYFTEIISVTNRLNEVMDDEDFSIFDYWRQLTHAIDFTISNLDSIFGAALIAYEFPIRNNVVIPQDCLARFVHFYNIEIEKALYQAE